jgi:hypothetical protein
VEEEKTFALAPAAALAAALWRLMPPREACAISRGAGGWESVGHCQIPWRALAHN